MSDTSCSVEDDLIKQRVLWWRQAIVRCIRTPELASRLAQFDVINYDEKSRLVSLYQNTPDEASNVLLDILINKDRPRKWKDFIQALTQEGFEYVISRLKPHQMETPEERERGRKIVQLFGPELEKDIDPIPLLSYLKSKGVLKEIDADEITNRTLNISKVVGMMILLDRVQCYLKPFDWWNHFLCALWKNGHEKKVKQLEPGYEPSNHSDVHASTSSYHTGEQDTEMEYEMTDHVDADSDNDVSACPDETATSTSLELTEDSVALSEEITYPPEQEKKSFKTCVGNDTEESLKRGRSDNTDGLKAFEGCTKDKEVPSPKRMKYVETEAYDHDRDSDECNDLSSEKGGSDIDEDDEKPDFAPWRRYEPRDYQLELAEKALRGQNTIICAETGTGKTWVALYIIDKHLEQAPGTRKVGFMARTGVLIRQQSNRFKKFLPYCTKQINADSDDSRMIDAIIPTNDIICFTPQILLNNIGSLSKFSLLVFDECHHTRGDEPYAKLARKYLIEKDEGQKELPQIIGLTASIGVGRSRTVEDAEDYIMHVSALLDVRPPLSTVERCRESFKKWVNTPEEEQIKMIVKDPNPCKEILLAAMEDVEKRLKVMMFSQPKMIELLYGKHPFERDSQAYNNWTVDIQKSAQQHVNDDQISRDIIACAVYLNVYNSAIEVSNLLQVSQVAKYLADKQRHEAEGSLKHTEAERKLFENFIEVQTKLAELRNVKDAANPNIQKVSDKLQKLMLEKGDDSRAIVFVKARATCRTLAEFLDRELQKIGVKATPMYGQQSTGADEGMTEREQTEILNSFRDGKFKVMVSTSVGTEGIDIPDCNIVVNYNFSGNEITKIQMKGRGRKKGATHLLMGDEKQLEQETINAYKANMMYKAIEELKNIDTRVVEHKVKMFQTEEMSKYRCKKDYENTKKSLRSEDDLEIMCRRCSTFACLVSEVRKLGSQHLVIAKDFPSKVTTKPHKNPKKYGGIEKKFKMYCKECPLDWGIVADQRGENLYILKLESFKMKNVRTEKISQHTKWLDVPYEVPQHGADVRRKETEVSALDK